MKHLPTIISHTVPHSSQQYDTVGNYWDFNNVWHVRISKCNDWRYEALVLIHELVEMILTQNNGVNWKEIDDFDTRGVGQFSNDPGAIPEAPYHKEHMLAQQVEQLMAYWMGINWDEYNNTLDTLEYMGANNANS